MTARQKKFAEFYAQTGNVYQSAVQAGYSESYAESRAHEMLVNVGVAAYLRELTEKAQDERILSAKARQVMLSEIAGDDHEDTADRIRAIDTLNKMTGEYTVRVEANVQRSEKLSEILDQIGGDGLHE